MTSLTINYVELSNSKIMTSMAVDGSDSDALLPSPIYLLFVLLWTLGPKFRQVYQNHLGILKVAENNEFNLLSGGNF